MKTMSDFIMEQEVTELDGISEIEVMEGFMQMNAIAAVAECYCEHANIAEFSSEAGLRVFSESDDNIMKKAWETVKGFFEKIWEWLKMVVKAIIQMISRTKLEKCIAKLQRWSTNGVDDEGKKFELTQDCGISSVIIDAENTLALIEEFSTCIKAGYTQEKLNESLDDFTKRAKELVENFKKNKKKHGAGFSEDYTREDEDGSERSGSTWGDVLDTLKNMQKHNTASNAHKLLKSLDFKKKEWHGEGAKTDNSDVKKVKDAAKWIAKAYDKYTAYTVKMVEKILKERIREEKVENINANTAALKKAENLGGDAIAKKAAKAAKAAAESYVENTDGYYFL